ncbi:MAG: permease-like cell division protein FtsX [Elusimicrobiales bacterium]|nr:permease-like cell division protein FtsX [Elusimicrobiales bacterium]
MADFLEKETAPAKPKHVGRLYRRLFLLVFAVAVLWQSALFIDMRLNAYYRELSDSFKVIFVVEGSPSNEVLEQMGETLNQKADVASVRLFSPADALESVRRQNPQLTESLLLMGKNKMPAYFELKLADRAVGNVGPLVDNLASEYEKLSPRYNAEHARLVFYTGLCAKFLRLALLFAGLLFLAFMFLVEAYPAAGARAHHVSGALSGVLAGVCSCAFFAVMLYPTGFLSEAARLFTTPERQILVLVFCGLLGWTLSKWQKF